MQPAGEGRHLVLLHALVLQDNRVILACGIKGKRQHLPTALKIPFKDFQ